jgi:predicted protein tyrosine phosphatase
MPEIHVSSLAKLHDTVARTKARHVVTLINAATVVERPASIAADRHLFIGVSDITEPVDGHIMPGSEHVETLLGFVRQWDRSHPIVIHCWAGISRSTAAAFITGCALFPHLDEMRLARRLREASPSATPNPALVAAADHLLDRKGRMVSAIQAIGRGADAFEGTPFHLPLHD